VQAAGRRLDDAALGRMLFELTAAARVNGLDPEAALRRHATAVMRKIEEKMGMTAAAPAGAAEDRGKGRL
jgi:XTP/dITP diphosphohydrolase/tetrapyrrole methylase family protein/MazG family protein